MKVNAGSGDDTFTVASLGTAKVALNAGGGNDTLVGPNATNTQILTGEVKGPSPDPFVAGVKAVELRAHEQSAEKANNPQ